MPSRLATQVTRRISHRVAAFLTCILTCVPAACGGGGDGQTGPSPAVSVAVSTSTLTTPAGGSVDLTASVARSGGFAGVVALTASGLPSGATGSFSPASLSAATTSATLTVVSSVLTPPGSYPITIRAAAAGLSEQTATTTLLITPRPSVALAMSAPTLSVQAGATGKVIAQLTRVSFPEGVTLSLEGAPSGVTGTFAVATLTGDTTSLSIVTTLATAPGVYPLVVRARSSLADQVTAVSLTVLPPPDFALSPASSSLSVRQVAEGKMLTRVTRTGGFTGVVVLTLENLPVGVSGSFRQASLADDTTTLTLVVGANASPATSAITIRGRTTGLPDRTTTLSLTVTSAGTVTLAVSPNTLSIEQGASKNTTVTITRTAPFTGAVTLTLTGAPAGVTPVFTSTVLASGSTTTTLTITVGAVGVGTYPLIVRGSPPAGSGLTDQTAALSLVVTPSVTSLTAQHLLAQEGLAIALASTVLQSQLQVLFAVSLTGEHNDTPCEALVGGGSVQSLPVGQPNPRRVGIYYDAACTRPYIIGDVTQLVYDAAIKRFDITETATYYGPTGTTLGVMTLQEAAVIGDDVDPYVAGLGTFTPANGAPTVRLGLTCTIPSSGAGLPCYGGVVQYVPSLGRSLGSVSLLSLTITDTNSPVTFTGNNSVLTVGDPGTLTLNLATATTLSITGGTPFGTSTQQGSAATFSLFPPTPTGWSVSDASHDMKFELQVVSNTVRNSVATITRISTGQVLATLAVDQSGTGTVTWSDGSSAAITSWMLAN